MLNLSPNKLTDITVKKRNKPGYIIVHGAYLMYSLPELSIAPHSGSGGWAPNPKKLNEAIEIIANNDKTELETISEVKKNSLWRKVKKAKQSLLIISIT